MLISGHIIVHSLKSEFLENALRLNCFEKKTRIPKYHNKIEGGKFAQFQWHKENDGVKSVRTYCSFVL